IKNKNELQKSVKTGKDGLVSLKSERGKRMEFYNVTMGNDKALMLSSLPWNNSYRMINDETTRLNIFTDRSIYRPGQIVYFKGIAFILQKDSSRIVENKAYTLSLKDPNGREIGSKTFRTNEMGSFSGEFILPYGLVNGTFSIVADNHAANAFFHVEEYKRPGFDIVFEPVKETYSFGDKITVRGETRTFSGVNLQNTQVRYRIVRRSEWWLYRTGRNETQVFEGFVRTDSEGKFAISFIAEKDLNNTVGRYFSSIYQVEASVTDDKGETRQSTVHIPIGTVSMLLTVPSLQASVDKDNLPELMVFSKNLNNQEVDSKGTYEIYSLKGEESLEVSWMEGDLTPDKLIVSGNFVSGEKINVDILKKMQSGRYRMTVKSNDDKGREISENFPFLLYSVKEKRPPVVMYEWFLGPKPECHAGETTSIVYGSSAKDVFVLYEIFKDGKKIEKSRFELSNSVKKLPITFLESYGDGIVASFTFVKDNQLFSRNFEIKKAKPKKELKLKMEVFRDKLTPGQKEEWKISVKDADKNPVVSELLASMYDASLDKIYEHNWNFYPKMDIGFFFPYFYKAVDWDSRSGYINFDGIQRVVPGLSFDQFNWFDLDMSGRMQLRAQMYGLGGKTADLKENAVSIRDVATAKAEAVLESVVNLEENTSKRESLNDGSSEPVQIRKNLNETAFFYPQLRTDTFGETLISFTVPESNTTWKLMALAHTGDLKYGQIMEKAISQKKLMVSPNVPRFVRRGDKTTLTTAISNLLDQTISGKVFLSFFDPATGKENIIVTGAQKDFSVAAGKTTTAGWTFEVPAGIDLTACKVVATADDFSDGEQHLLPVLPNRIMVTESLPLYISGKGNKQFTLDKLVNNKSASLENYRLSLEFADNPVWYAVQALPAMATPANDDVISWFAAYYANNMAVSIANSIPKMKQVIDVWIEQGGSKETLLSNLEKNQELKAILLEETPWLMDGKTETEQKQRLGLLFDVNRSANLNKEAVSKLGELQRGDGGWSWFKGMNSSVAVTQWLLYGMVQLSERSGIEPDSGIRNMQKNAIEFIDDRFVKNFENLKKYDKNWEKKNTISTYEIEYLLVRSMYPELPETDKVSESVDFYRKIAL
ncbi:MAG: alpha-2-macroglobulin, partial [Dysgonamonadaceae bacterium]|nr:alpha-2-macroglobulin [Dysgonamonadaceae bacterium]